MVGVSVVSGAEQLAVAGGCGSAVGPVTPVVADLGLATTAGTGCGVVLSNVSASLVARCESLGRALAKHYDGRPLPDGKPGRLDLATGHTG
jgi:hypothetical protein